MKENAKNKDIMEDFMVAELYADHHALEKSKCTASNQIHKIDIVKQILNRRAVTF